MERAAADLRRGEPWLARDRLLGALRASPLDQEVLRGLAEVYTALGDLPAAGTCWFITGVEDTDPAADAGLTALRARYRSAIGVAHAVRVRGRIVDYPGPARSRLLDLQAELSELGRLWTPPARPRPVARSPRHGVRHAVADASQGVLWVTVAVALAVANLGIYVVGVIAILRAIW